MSARRVRVLSFWGGTNLGDEAMLRGLLGSIERLQPDAAISVSCWNPAAERVRYPGIEFHPLVLHGAAGRATCRAAWRSLADLWRADLVVTTGGPFLTDAPAGRCLGLARPNLAFLAPLFEISAAARFGKRPWVVGQSIGPFRWRVTRSIARRGLRRAGGIWCREPGSAADLQHLLGADRVVHVAPDLAFARTYWPSRPASTRVAPPPPSNGREGELNGAAVAINVRLLRDVLAVPGAEGVQERYETVLADVTRRLVQRGATVRFLPQTAREDIPVAERIRARAGNPPAVTIVPRLADVGELLEHLHSARVGLVTRYHSALLAVRAGLPALAIDYMPKVGSAFRMLGLDELVVPLADLDAERLERRIANLVADEGRLRGKLREVAAGQAERLEQLFSALLSPGMNLRPTRTRPPRLQPALRE